MPATSIVQTRNGRFGLGSRVDEEAGDPIFVAGVSSECMGETSLDDDGTDPNHKYNYLRVGSETLTQVGWHIATLCTEYELLSRNGQTDQMQRTLEEIFLALQAIRRLDMQTQCLIEEMYNARKSGTKKFMCEDPYTDTKTFSPFGSGHVNFDSEVEDDCKFKANYSGYNGFFIREDATQQLEQILHDPNDETYNIDGVNSSFAQSTNEFQLCPKVDRFCYMAHDQNFISQDQVSNLLYGFSFIKRFIPANATVTTCDGTSYNIRAITSSITEALVFNIDDHDNRIVIPNSGDCCKKPVKISTSAGGHCGASVHGMIMAYEYITGNKRKSTLGQRALFNASAGWPNRDKLYYYRFNAATRDISKMNETARMKFRLACVSSYSEIYLLGNDIMFPEGEDVSDELPNFLDFKEMLCDAPCSGPCSKAENYDDPTLPPDAYPDFSCPNSPNWLGTRWEAQQGGRPLKNPKDVLPEQFNGLDYMALFNMYAIHNNLNVPYYNPDLPADPNNFIGGDQIDGPSQLCVGQTGSYTLKRLYSSTTTPSLISNISWTSSTNMTVFSPSTESTDVKMNSKADPSHVAVTFDEDRITPQYYEGSTTNSANVRYPNVKETCSISNRKKVLAGIPEYTIQDNGFSFCGPRSYTLVVEGPDFPDNKYKWSFKNFIANGSITTATGKSVTIQVSTSQYSYGEISVDIETICGSVTIKKNVNFMECSRGLGGGGGDNSILVFPNPGRDEISMAFTQDNYEIPPNGIPIQIVRANSGQVIRTERVYSKISTINTSTLMNGSYNIQATTPEFGILNSSFIISRD